MRFTQPQSILLTVGILLLLIAAVHRPQKRGKQPDFRLRARGTDRDGSGRPDALWIQDRKTPSWVTRSLQLLPGGKGYELKPFIPADALQGTPAEQQWVQVFENYGQFWDNRANVSGGIAPACCCWGVLCSSLEACGPAGVNLLSQSDAS
jgi:hypothetical protein